MRTFNHLSLEEREKFFVWKQQGISLREIGKRLCRSHSTFSREKVRNAKYGKAYLPCKADEKYIKRARRQRYQAPLKEPLIFLYVREHLRQRWSPEEISGRLPIDYPGKYIDDETIYRYIYAKKNRRMKFWQYLTIQRQKRMKKGGRDVKRLGKIPNAVSIDLRPKEVNSRKIPGHWETDNMEGVRSDKTVVSVTAERLTRYTMLDKLMDKTARQKAQSIKVRMSLFPNNLRKTLTSDNGAENSNHKDISGALHLPMYFCHSYHSWEKGTVENTIGRVRRFLPKGKSLENLSEKKLARIEYFLNNTPRKCLGYLTPYEKMISEISDLKET